MSKIQLADNGRSGELKAETMDFIPGDCSIRPTQDRLLVEPRDVMHSRVLYVPAGNTKPLRGVVRAAGPGKYEIKYNHPDKGKRTRMWESNTFIPMGVKVGEEIELGGAEKNGYAFEGFFWGDKYVIWATERDVCCVLDPEPLDTRPAARPQTIFGRDISRNPPR